MKCLTPITILLLAFYHNVWSQNLITNGDFENGSDFICGCPDDYTCYNNAARVIDGIHPLYIPYGQACISPSTTNYTNSLGAYNGNGYVYFYAGADAIDIESFAPLLVETEIVMSIWYAGPQVQGWLQQDSPNAFIQFLVDGNEVGPRVEVPTFTGWTQHCFFGTVDAGYHTFGVRSGNEASYAIWIDDFSVSPLTLNQSEFELGNDTALCQGETLRLDATVNDASYVWQDNSTFSTLDATVSGTYWVKVSAGCQSLYDTIHVEFIPYPDVNLGDDINLCEGQSINLNVTNGNATYLWNDGTIQPIRLIEVPNTYWVELANECGIIRDTLEVGVETENCACKIYYPNTFTPNNDGLNDHFSMLANCSLYNYELIIYNRWGEEIFQSNDINDSWDGTSRNIELDTDVYTFYLSFNYGTGEFGKETGYISLLR